MGFLPMRFGFGCGGEACEMPSTTAMTFSTLISLSPFLATFAVVSTIVTRKIFPRLAQLQSAHDGEDHYLPASAPPSLRQVHAEHGKRSMRRRIAAAAFATTMGLAAVLAELILAEILELVDAEVRDAALRVTVPALLFFLVVLIPFLELQSIVASAGWSFQRTAKGRVPRLPWMLLLTAFGLWLFLFWSVGMAVPSPVESYLRYYSRDARSGFDSTGMSMALRWGSKAAYSALDVRGWQAEGTRGLARACLERIGVIGIALMALLSGFASVSSPWQTFSSERSRRRKPVTDADINRKQGGLEATSELLATKRHQLRSLQRKMAGAGSTGGPPSLGTTGLRSTAGANANSSSSSMLGKLVGSIKGVGNMVIGGNSDALEIKSLMMEIGGLETMEANLRASVSSLRTKQAAEQRWKTPMGRLLAVPNMAFGLYCLYRILATFLTTAHRLYYPEASFSSSDPINRFLGLLAKHWDPKLDQMAWARQISFLLSGVILAAAANSVVQTLHIFSKWTPGLLRQAQANLPLVVGQIGATYVISSAMLLRSNLPREVGSAVGDALESALEPGFVDRWFEGWFLVASAATGIGIWIGRKLAAGDAWDDWDDYYGEEMGQKRC